MPSLDQLKDWYQTHQEEILTDFKTFLSFPSISADPAHAADVRRTAEWLCDQMKGCGLESTLWETSGFPVVFGTYRTKTPDRPTLLIYNHYDVQPVDPLELWKSDPFQPVVKDNQIYARGASDNKGQCFYTLLAIKAFLQLAQRVDCNLKWMVEGEEESGGKGTAEVLTTKREELKADHLLIVDFDMPASHTPAVTLGMRGILTMEVECANSAIDLHSGVHGGIALNPNRALVDLLHSLWDTDGRVTVNGFYDAVQDLKASDLSLIDMSFDEAAYRKDFGVNAFCNEKGYSIKEANGVRPTLEINGMWGGYTGAGFKTVIPAKAYAKLSCRLAPNQDPEEIGRLVAAHLKAHAPKGIDVHTAYHHGAAAYRSPIDSPIVKTAALAYKEVFGTPCKYVLCGASVPIVVELAHAAQAEVAMIGVALASDDIHAPNEHFSLERLEQGYLSMGRVLSLINKSGL